ncbi:MAG TPA: NAD-dependent epimerase/dehydratase family protein [Candidatus Thermoplasmatota archaeon]|nr:NAD-dependent epimerase/dehydratase family protein [Candidatus Thermoplasmatota archaeon]
MRICVTGSSGQIGSYVVDECASRGIEAVGLDLRPSRWTAVVGDVRDREAVARAARGADALIHLAAHVSVTGSLADPIHDASTNVLGTIAAIEGAAAARVGRFVLVSSAAVYGAPRRLPLREDDDLAPISPYGVGKMAAERYVRVLAPERGVGATIARPFNVYSPRQDPSSPYAGVMSRFARAVADAEAPTVFGDGSATRDFVHAADVARWLVALAREPCGGEIEAVNLASGRETSVLSLAEAFCSAAGAPLRPSHAPPRPGEISRSVADVAKARARGLAPTVAVDAGIREMVEHARGKAKAPTP